MSTIHVLAKRRFRFAHPSMRSSEALQKAISELKPNQPLDGFHDTHPDSLRAQEAPEWITSDPLFALAVKDGDIFIVPSPPVAVAAVEVPDEKPKASAKPAKDKTSEENAA